VRFLRKFAGGSTVKDLRSINDPLTLSRLDAARIAARAAKNWAESDRIRDELAAMGIAVKDNKDGTTTWEVAR
jgi:cysteinyl-tRNA synthetase